MWCSPTACEAGTPPVPSVCANGPPDTWITGSASDPVGRGAWYSFTTGAAATTYTITTRVDYTTFDNYLNLFGACPPNQTVYDTYQLYGVDDASPSAGGWPGAGTTIIATTDDTAQGCAEDSSGHLCASMSVTGLALNTVYYVLANSYSDPGLTNGVPTAGYTNQLTFGIAVLTGASINAQQVNVGPNPCCHSTTPYGSPGGTCTALPPAPSPPPASTTTGTPAPSPAAGSVLVVF